MPICRRNLIIKIFITGKYIDISFYIKYNNNADTVKTV